jgi:hypothetical protein
VHPQAVIRGGHQRLSALGLKIEAVVGQPSKQHRIAAAQCLQGLGVTLDLPIHLLPLML